MPSGALVPAAEAAAKAAASHIWSESYKQGVSEGWAAGWAAALADLDVQVCPSEVAAPDPGSASTPASPAAQMEVTTEGSCFELDAAWAELFLTGEARRAAKRRRLNDMQHTASERVELDLGGGADALRVQDCRRLYGNATGAVLETETEMKAAFEALVAQHRAALWPVISIREGEAPGASSSFKAI